MSDAAVFKICEIAGKRYEIEMFFKNTPSLPSVNPYEASPEQVGLLQLQWRYEVPTEHVTPKLTRIKHIVRSRLEHLKNTWVLSNPKV